MSGSGFPGSVIYPLSVSIAENLEVRARVCVFYHPDVSQQKYSNHVGDRQHCADHCWYALSLFPLTLIAIFEYLSHERNHNGGIVFAKKDFSNLTTFTSFYLPTILAGIYSMAWAWIAVDTKRLEPYFQMSKT